jgi:hypothetical protein
MTTQLATQSIVAIATLLAALIASAISFVNLTLTKELKTSEFRQRWIDGLREELAAFFGAARSFARAVEVKHLFGQDYDEKLLLLMTAEKISELRYQAAETFSKIKLRLNPDEAEHIELLRLLKRSIDEQNEMLANKSDATDTLLAIEIANEYARPVLKREWQRVKEGELAFRVARNWVAPAIVVVSLAFIIFIMNGKATP